MNMRKEEKQTEMVFRYHYEKLTREQKIELRDEFMKQSGVSLPAFYQKKAADAFKPLELDLLNKLLEIYN